MRLSHSGSTNKLGVLLRDLSLLLVSYHVFLVDGQVPGMVHTKSGYDNVDGEDAICWSAPAFHNETAVEESLLEGNETNHEEHDDSEIDGFSGVNWQSELVPSFLAGPTKMLPSCPQGTSVHVDILPDAVFGSFRMRTNHPYTFHVVGKVDLEAIRNEFDLSSNSFFYSSDGHPEIGLLIEFCPVNGNLCSPFSVERLDTEQLDSEGHTDGDAHDEGEPDDDHDDEESDGHVDILDTDNDHENGDHDDHDDVRRRAVYYLGHLRAKQ